jgi:hypothetical protein
MVVITAETAIIKTGINILLPLCKTKALNIRAFVLHTCIKGLFSFNHYSLFKSLRPLLLPPFFTFLALGPLDPISTSKLPMSPSFTAALLPSDRFIAPNLGII